MDIKDFNLPDDGVGSLRLISGQVTGLSTLKEIQEQVGKAVSASWLPEMAKSGAVGAIQNIDWGAAASISPAIVSQFQGHAIPINFQLPAMISTFGLSNGDIFNELAQPMIDMDDEYICGHAAQIEALEAARDVLAVRCAAQENTIRELRMLRRSEVLDASQEYKPDPPVNESPFPDPK